MDVRSKLRPGRFPAALLLAALIVAVAASPAAAASPRPPAYLPPTPAGFEVSAREAVRAARADARVAGVAAGAGRLSTRVEARPAERRWQVGYFDGEREVAVVFVDPGSGAVTESWTGDQVAWPMARGYEGQFGHALNAPYVWIPLAAIFLVGLLDWRRPWRTVHLDLIVLLAFGVSHVFFNQGEIGLSVPLAYPPLLYLLARTLWIGFRGAGAGLRPTAPVAVLAVGAVFLLAFRVALNVADSGVIDVGYAGVVGADRIASGEPIYGEGAFPDDNPTGDTYGPANYYAYVPFELAFPWSGEWDQLPAGHAAAIFFDLATVAGLFLLGGRLRPRAGGGLWPGREGRSLGVVLAFGWSAYPYTALALQSNSNDALVGALVVWALVAFASPWARGGLLGLAAMVKFAPLALVPLFAAGERGIAARLRPATAPAAGRPGTGELRPVAAFTVALAATATLMLAHPAIDPGLAAFWERTIENQLDRESPFSVWGQEPGLGWLQATVAVGALALALVVGFVPARRSLARIAALAAATLIAAQLAVEHWFYLYLPWFFALVLAALAAEEIGPAHMARRDPGTRSPADP